jgi:O-antigen/teichoic acid export membrane protein
LSLAKAREIWSFSQWLIISRVGSFLNRKCDEFVVGGSAGTSSMGSYHVANEIATMPSGELVMPVRRAMFPNLAKLIERPQEFAAAVVSTFSVVAAACLFVGACLMVTAPEFVAVVLGAKWIGAVPVFRWLAVFGGFSALLLVLEVPLWVSGRTRISAFQTWLELALIAPLAWFAVLRFGVEGAAVARVVVVLAMVPLMMYLCSAIESVTFSRLLGAMWRPSLAAMAMVAAANVLTGAWSSALLVLVGKLAVCVLTFPVALLVLWLLSGKPDGLERVALGYFTSPPLRIDRAR